MSLVAIRNALLEVGATRLSREHPVWEVSAPWWPFSRRARRHEAVRLEMLEASVALASPTYLVVGENPQEYDVGGSWAHAQARTWVVPEGCSVEALQSELLMLGDWALYTCPEPVDPDEIPDLFRTEAPEVAEFATAAGVPLLMEAFHDNDPWRIWLEEVSTQREAAA